MPYLNYAQGWLALAVLPRWSLILLFSLLGFGFNFLRLPLLFDIDFIFGSVFALLALVLLGGKAAIIVGIFAASATVLIWQHPFAWLIFSSEILWLSLRYGKNNQSNLVLLDLQFWLFALPAIIGCYAVVLDSSLQTAVLIVLKQISNGIFNTLVVAVFVAMLQLNKPLSKKLALPEISLRQLVFLTLLSLTLLSGAMPVILDAKKSKAAYELAVADRLAEISAIMALQLDNIPKPSSALLPSMLQPLAASLPIERDYALALVNSQKQFTQLVGQNQTISFKEPISLLAGFAHWKPSSEPLPIQRWRKSRYVFTYPARWQNEAVWLVLEQPAAPVVTELEQDSAQQLVRLVLFLGLTIGISALLSKAISLPLRRIDVASQRIQADLTQQQKTVMPQTRVLEYSNLSHTLAQMSARLNEAFQRSRMMQCELEQQVTQRTEALQQSHSQQNAILSAASDFSIIATDPNGVIQFFSVGAEKMLGYQAEELIGKHTPEMLHRSSEVVNRAKELNAELAQPVKGFRAFVIKAEQEGSETHEWTYLHKSGQAIPVSLTVTVIRDHSGEISGYLGIARDVSELQRTERLKNEFIATVSHELRTPLTAIYASLRLVNSGKIGELNSKTSKLLSIAEQNSERLTLLINDLLDIEKLISGKFVMPLQIQPLQPLLEAAVEGVLSYANEYQIRFSIDVLDPTIQANVNAERLIQVIVNLLSNAIKFSPKGAEIKLVLRVKDHHALLEVTDRGEGIKDEFKPRIFQKFAQGDAASNRNKGGTGLGLAITKELTEKMGGQVGFDSQYGLGSTFWLAFALAEPESCLNDETS
ncbi:PAS domain S-box protein [Rheinheimera sp. UJ51]|uniref:ATP-binding protein n=1 Tax=unclassified Rheinheimera TaxID=115860 RepID=UPI001E3F0D72|nr:MULTISPECIES: ATP-binding protein [unclassified Rheinheimera]MCC5452427.1 PAS domain S-box protein [Rheinheimera sp. UJ51]MCF4010248.1 ATP-binding protein [Rheinheimera sp. UJ63]